MPLMIAAWRRLQRNEKRAHRGDKDEIGEQIFEREDIVSNRLGDCYFLDPAHIAALPVGFGAFRM
jgi:hypothetical protein